jgi:GDP-4-dehydro-6-deoxy-D-mannose reductase
MDTSRDITDVRDIVRGYRLLLQMGKSGHVYNIGSGRCTSVRRIVSELVELSKMEIEVQVDSSKFRPTDVPAIAANIEKIRMDTGWEPTIELVTTLADTLQFWRQH